MHFAGEKSSHFSSENKLTNLGEVISTLVKIVGLVSKSVVCWSPSVSWEIANMEANGNALPVIQLGNIGVVPEHQRKIDRTLLVKKAWQSDECTEIQEVCSVPGWKRWKPLRVLYPFFRGHQEVEGRAGCGQWNCQQAFRAELKRQCLKPPLWRAES